MGGRVKSRRFRKTWRTSAQPGNTPNYKDVINRQPHQKGTFTPSHGKSDAEAAGLDESEATDDRGGNSQDRLAEELGRGEQNKTEHTRKQYFQLECSRSRRRSWGMPFGMVPCSDCGRNQPKGDSSPGETNTYSTRDIPVFAQAPTTWNKANLGSVNERQVKSSTARSPDRVYVPVLSGYQEIVFPAGGRDVGGHNNEGYRQREEVVLANIRAWYNINHHAWTY